MRHEHLRLAGLICAGLLAMQLTGCPPPPGGPAPVQWPISKDVYTTAEEQVLPIGLPLDTPAINPADVPLYETFGYSAWHRGAGTEYGTNPDIPQPYDKRIELAPSYTDAANAARLLSFFAITDIHITDKESPAQVLYNGWTAAFGPSSAGLFVSSYSPVILSTTQVLDAAIQTANALHEMSPFDFGISLGDDINNNQFNELRWFIDVLDGKVITPSSGAHDGACFVDYQKPYKAAGLNKEILWYQALGNHDQYFSGIAYESVKTRTAHEGNAIINVKDDIFDPNAIEETGNYQGVVDGTTPYGDVIKAGPEADFPAPPTVVADKNRHALSTDTSSSLSWMSEFFDTTSKPKGHGFTKANLDEDFACYSFEPKSNLPLRILVLDDTNKKDPSNTSPLFIGSGALDSKRLDWLTGELQKGQDEGMLMIVATHIPIKPQKNLDDTSPYYAFWDHDFEDSLLDTLHAYPNLILLIAGHRHLNTVTPQPYDPTVDGQGPENSFWEVETASLRDFPQQLRTFDICRNSDNTLSIFVTDVDPAVVDGTPAAKSRGYAIGAARIFGATDEILADTTSHAYNAELVKQLTPEMQTKIAALGSPIE